MDQLSGPGSGSPVFLLDSMRMLGYPQERWFDNRWVTSPQDFPSAKTLKSAHIETCYVVTTDSAIGDDLVRVLIGWQDAGIALMLWTTDRFGPKLVRKRSLIRRIWRAMRIFPPPFRDQSGAFGRIIRSSGG